MTEEEFFKDLAPEVNPIKILKEITRDLSLWYLQVSPGLPMEEEIFMSEDIPPTFRGARDRHFTVKRGPIISKVVASLVPYLDSKIDFVVEIYFAKVDSSIRVHASITMEEYLKDPLKYREEVIECFSVLRMERFIRGKNFHTFKEVVYQLPKFKRLQEALNRNPDKTFKWLNGTNNLLREVAMLQVSDA